MDASTIVQQMNDYLFKAAECLSAWLAERLPQSGDDWWEECVMSNLSFNQRELAERKNITELSGFDLAALLRITDKSWYTMRGYLYLPTKEREVIRDMVSVRNDWAHCSTDLPGKDQILWDISTLCKFFSQIDKEEYVEGLQEFRKAVETPGHVTITPKMPEPQPATPVPVTSVVTDKPSNSIIPSLTQVYLVGTPTVKGMVVSAETIAGTNKYTVFVDGVMKTYYEGQIACIDTAPKYNWVSSETLRSYLTAYQINNPAVGSLYSLNAARIDFVPYQFRPALKLIKSDEPRILIADSVGVGKTIEAGLIIKELEARQDIESIMIICPKPLVADRKWEEEMKRFDEEFVPLDGDTLRQIISDTDRDGEWPARYNRTIVPYSILDSRAYEGEESKHGKKFGLADLDPAPHFDLVIIDEAHHLRNGSMEKEKAFAYKCAHYFCEHASAVVMLTATPLQTDDDDLYTLLNLLRPDVVIDKKTFGMLSRPNPFISQASRLIRAAKADWQELAAEALQKIETTQWGETVIANNPAYAHSLQVLAQENVSREERVQLISDVESLHSFHTIINRTRRKDIQDFCVRRTATLETAFTPEQKDLHDSLLAFEVAALSKLHGSRGVKFMMSTIRRQAASCIFGLAPFINDIISRRIDQLLDDPDEEAGGEFGEMDVETFRALASDILEKAAQLPGDDPKFDSVFDIVQEKQQQANNKIIVFSTFRHTLYYVHKKLKERGIRVAQIDGSVGNDDRLELRHRFELPKENPDAIDMLLFTEVGSEGLDYQFCDTMINYDLPWNPMRIEQRIGRIDRRGQVSEVVHIYNAITSDTVDADIYNRCLMRIGVFESSIGECEEILGEIGSSIEKIVMDTKLTDEERRIKLEQIADNEVRKAQELNHLESEEKELFGFDLSNYTMSKEVQAAESPFLTARSLQHLVEMYLKDRLGDGNYILGEKELKTIRLRAAARNEILTDLRALPGTRNALRRKWELYLKGEEPTHSLTFESETAEKNRSAFFITPVHPLVKQAARYYSNGEVSNIHLDYYSDEIPTGDYPMAIYAWNYVGVRSNFKLVAVCPEKHLEAELPEYIINARAVDAHTDVSDDCWKALEEAHVSMWTEAKQQHVQSTEQLATFKLESIRNNYRNQRLVLQQKLADADNDKLITMYKAQMENAEEKFLQKEAKIKVQTQAADIHTALIANGIITVKRG